MDDWKPEIDERVLVHFKHPEPCDVPGIVVDVVPPHWWGETERSYSILCEGKPRPLWFPMSRLRKP